MLFEIKKNDIRIPRELFWTPFRFISVNGSTAYLKLEITVIV